MQTVFDVTKGADYRAAFDLIPESRVKAILSTNWSGQMFSQRVWDNTNALADGLKHDMLVGICCLPRKTQKVGNHGISRNKAG